MCEDTKSATSKSIEKTEKDPASFPACLLVGVLGPRNRLMGASWSGDTSPRSILVVGLQNAGKTTILDSVKTQSYTKGQSLFSFDIDSCLNKVLQKGECRAFTPLVHKSFKPNLVSAVWC